MVAGPCSHLWLREQGKELTKEVTLEQGFRVQLYSADFKAFLGGSEVTKLAIFRQRFGKETACLINS